MRLDQTPDRIFMDATYTICSGKSSGIERVVRNLFRECEQLSTVGQIPQLTRVVSHGGSFYELRQEYFDAFQKTASMQANVLRDASPLYLCSAKGICRAVRSQTARRWLLPQPGHLGIFKILHSLRQTAVFQDLARESVPIEAGPGDLFILPDAYWVNRLRNSVWPAATKARQMGATIASVVYDLIPLTHPQFVGFKRRDAFHDYLLKAASCSDLLVTISNTVQRQLSEFLAEEFCSQNANLPKLGSFQLGAELQTVEGAIRSKLQQIFSGKRNPYLMVATFDPRKNHQYLLDAFERLWGIDPHLELCLVGRIGSRCDDVIQRISEHPLLGKKLHLFDDLSDAELQYCYRHARGVIFPSIVEGFGLPIVESLWFGNKTFVSDTPIHREVGRDDCSYFSLACPSSLVQQILEWETLLGSEQPVLPTRRSVSWKESCREFLDHCYQCYAENTIVHGRRSQAA